MGITLTRCATVLVFAMLLSGFPGAASARWPVGDGDSALGFGASYAAPDGQSRTHHGCDLLGSPGEPVLFPTAGTVRFAGSVPGPHGGSVLAITIETNAGALVTMLPLGELQAAAGDRVEEGESAGQLAERGDPSTDSPHLHVSVRVGGLYVDPLPYLGQPDHAGSSCPERSAEVGTGSAGRSAASDGSAPEVRPERDDAPSGLAAGEPSMLTLPSPLEETQPRGTTPEQQQTARAGASDVGAAPTAPDERATQAGARADASERRTASLRDRRTTPGSVPAADAPRVSGRSPILQALGVRIERIARAWVALALVFCGAVTLWPIWRGGSALFSNGRNACGSPVGSEVVAAPGR